MSDMTISISLLSQGSHPNMSASSIMEETIIGVLGPRLTSHGYSHWLLLSHMQSSVWLCIVLRCRVSHFSGHWACFGWCLGGELELHTRGGNQRWGKLGNQSRGCHIALPGHLSWQSRDYVSWLPPPWLEERPWELGLLVNTLTSLTALYNLNFPDALHDKKVHIWSQPGKWKRLNTVLQRIMKVLPWSAIPHCIFMA